MIDISIVIVTYNSQNDINLCLRSIALSNCKKLSYEIIIVDNDSKDLTVSIINDFKKKNQNLRITIIESGNKGFNAGNNIGISQAKGKYILLLNPDTEIFSNTLKDFFDRAESLGRFGCLGCVMKKPDGSKVFSGGYFPSITSSLRKIIKRNHVIINNEIALQEVDFPSGAAFLFCSDIVGEIGLMDENYFLFYDETDYAYQMTEKGYKNYLLTSTEIIHKLGQSTSAVADFSIQKNLESYFYFLKKNYNFFYSHSLIFIDFFALILHFTLAKLINHKAQKYFKKNIIFFWLQLKTPR